MSTTGPPPPPPPKMAEDDGVDPANNSGVKHLWDLVAVYGPITRLGLHAHRWTSNGDYREYIRHHPQYKGNASSQVMAAAERWMFDRAVDLSLERGWLVQDADGVISIGSPPPAHTPLATLGDPGQVAIRVSSLESKQALAILTAKANLARKKVNRRSEGYRELERSLKGPLGQLEDVVIWRPEPRSWPEPIIVNGTTRTEILTKLGMPVRTRELPPSTPASEVLLMRIQHEIAGTSKDYTREGRDAYIAQLAEAGVSQKEIAEQVGLAQARVSQILSAVSVHLYRGQEPPTEADVAEFVTLRAAGWTHRDIAERTQWSKSTVFKHLARWDETGGVPAPAPVKRVRRSDTVPRYVAAVAASTQPVTVAEALDAAGLRVGPAVGKAARDDGYVRVVSGTVGRGGDVARYTVTDEGRQFLADTPAPRVTQQEAAAPPEPVAPVFTIVPPLPDLGATLTEHGYTAEQVVDLGEVLTECGVSWDDAVRWAKNRERLRPGTRRR